MDTISEETPIQEFYRGQTILITGGTGFLGRIIIEKLMRSSPYFNKIYLIVRPKKGKDQKQRINDIFDNIIFSKVNPKMFEKLSIISGDCTKPMLGLSITDQEIIKENVSIIIHCAATVRFDESLKLAAPINVAATKDLVLLSSEIKNLKAFVHVSTAFSNCNLTEIKERFYEPHIKSNQLMTITEYLNEEQLNELAPTLLCEFPNSYVFTKAVAEDVVKTYGKNIPVAVVRPSIILSSNKEPVPGWIDNLYGPTGIIVGIVIGLVRFIELDPEVKVDVVPVDMVANAIIASAWDLSKRKHKENTNDPPIYNVVSSVRNPITWSYFINVCCLFWSHSVLSVWYASFFIEKSSFRARIYTLLLHYLPAIIIDTFRQIIGKKIGLLKLYQKYKRCSILTRYFALRQWEYCDKNTIHLWHTLDVKDKEIYPFNVEELNWEEYFYNYTRGVRQYILKDDLSTVPQGIKRNQWLCCVHYGSATILTVITGYFLLFVGKYIINLIPKFTGLISFIITELLTKDGFIENIFKMLPMLFIFIFIFYIIYYFYKRNDNNRQVGYTSSKNDLSILVDNIKLKVS